MSLLDVQRSLVGFARGSLAEYQGCDNLTHREYTWLNQLLDSPGLQVTQQTQQWWRIARLCSAAPLSVALLKRNGMEELLINYITHEPVRTLFFAAELEQFKHFLQQHPQVNSTTKNMVAFEAGIKLASQLSTESNAAAEHFSLVLMFDRDPIALLGALLTGAPLPPLASENYRLEINSHWASLWRCHPCNNTNLNNIIASNHLQLSPEQHTSGENKKENR